MLKDFTIVFCFMGLCLFSCKKKQEPVVVNTSQNTIPNGFQNGLPTNPNHIHAYFFYGYHYFPSYGEHSHYAAFSKTGENLMATAMFRKWLNPNLITSYTTPNSTVNCVAFNSDTLYYYQDTTGAKAYALYYTTNYDSIFPPAFTPKWFLNGGNDFYSFSTTVPRGLPIVNSFSIGNVSIAAGKTFTIPSTVKNFDSLYMEFNQSFNSVILRSGKDSIVTIPPNFLSSFSTGGTWIKLRGFNYSYMISHGKTYVFELCCSGAYISSTLTP